MKIAIIGGGPGGYVAAIRAAQLGAEVTLIEKNKLGGTCLNVGCIPTKALVDSAHVFHDAGHSLEIGVEAVPVLHWDKVQARREKVVQTLVNGVKGLMKSNKITVLYGTASFRDKNTLCVTTSDGREDIVQMDRCIIASGSVPVMPPIPGMDKAFCIDSTDALQLEKPPESMIVVGGGVIGIEFACAYHEFGTKVTVVEMLDHILPTMDRELSDMLRVQMEARGIEVLTGAKVVQFAPAAGGGNCTVSCEGGEKTLTAEKILVCLGRRPETGGLKLENAGIQAERQIPVDDHLRTCVPEIYAVGDCNGLQMLAHAAFEHGCIAAENAMGLDRVFAATACPGGIYSFPEVAGVGLTEEQAKEQGLSYDVGVFPTSANGRALIDRDTNGCVKIISGKQYGEILGVHILSANATELIAEGALAIQLECTVDELINTIHSHPTVSECMHEAAMMIQGRAIHVPNRKK